jgi:hypothetical protein
MSKNRHTDSGKFMPGKSTGVYRGQMKHGPGVEHVKDALHTAPSRKVVQPHDGVQSVSTDAGRKPHAHDCADGGCNKAANAAFNDAVQNPTPETTNAGRLVGSGIKLS